MDVIAVVIVSVYVGINTGLLLDMMIEYETGGLFYLIRIAQIFWRYGILISICGAMFGGIVKNVLNSKALGKL